MTDDLQADLQARSERAHRRIEEILKEEGVALIPTVQFVDVRPPTGIPSPFVTP